MIGNFATGNPTRSVLPVPRPPMSSLATAEQTYENAASTNMDQSTCRAGTATTCCVIDSCGTTRRGNSMGHHRCGLIASRSAANGSAAGGRPATSARPTTGASCVLISMPSSSATAAWSARARSLTGHGTVEGLRDERCEGIQRRAGDGDRGRCAKPDCSRTDVPADWTHEVVAAVGLNVRSEPKVSTPSSANVLCAMPSGQKVRVLSRIGDWMQINWPIVGWSFAPNLKARSAPNRHPAQAGQRITYRRARGSWMSAPGRRRPRSTGARSRGTIARRP